MLWKLGSINTQNDQVFFFLRFENLWFMCHQMHVEVVFISMTPIAFYFRIIIGPNIFLLNKVMKHQCVKNSNLKNFGHPKSHCVIHLHHQVVKSIFFHWRTFKGMHHNNLCVQHINTSIIPWDALLFFFYWSYMSSTWTPW